MAPAVGWDEGIDSLLGLPGGGLGARLHPSLSLLHPEVRDEVLASLERSVDLPTPYRIEHRIRWRDGALRCGAGGSSTRDGAVGVTGSIGCMADLTDRLTRELEHRQLVADALAAADAERLQRERFQFLSEVNDALNESPQVRDIMRNVARAAVPRLGDWCAFYLCLDGGDVEVELNHIDPAAAEVALRMNAAAAFAPGSSIERVLRTGSPENHLAEPSSAIEHAPDPAEVQRVVGHLGCSSSIAVPLIKQGRILGAAQFVLSDPSRRYTEDDVALAELVAARVAVSVENRRLFERQRHIAETLQRSLLPAALPEIPGVDAAVRYWATGEATEVGGDFYDLFPIDDEHWGVLIGDVCGKGPGAAAAVGLARHCVREAAWHGDGPVEVLVALNRALRRSGIGTFCTAAFAVLSPSAAGIEMDLSCGGHPLPVVVSASGTRAVGVPGTLLGAFEDVRGHVERVTLEPGDTIVLFTDGATDVRPPHGLTAEQFADLVGDVVAASGGGAGPIADALHDELEALLPFEHRRDDVALLVLQHPDPATTRTGARAADKVPGPAERRG